VRREKGIRSFEIDLQGEALSPSTDGCDIRTSARGGEGRSHERSMEKRKSTFWTDEMDLPSDTFYSEGSRSLGGKEAYDPALKGRDFRLDETPSPWQCTGEKGKSVGKIQKEKEKRDGKS